MKIDYLKVNHVHNPLGYALDHVSMSFIVMESTGKKLACARILVSRNTDLTDPVYDSGLRGDIDSLSFEPELQLQPMTRYYWNVFCEADNGDSAVSETAWFETGKMGEPWIGKWIRAPFEKNVHPLLQRNFRSSKAVKSARLYICGLGLYEAYINGEKVSDEYLTPYFTDYQNFVQYQTYDVTSMLFDGDNALGVMLGNGWCCGRLTWLPDHGSCFGGDLEVIADLVLTYEDGTVETVGTDENWLCQESCILDSNIYDGEWIDARREIPGWATAACDLSAAVQAVSAEAPAGALQERRSVPVKRLGTLEPQELIHTPAGELLLDFGQIITGWFTFEDCLPEGREIRLECSELLQDDNFYNENLRSAKEQFTYISAGKKTFVRPRFTYYSFRYLRVTGMTEDEIRRANITGWIMYSDLETTGSMETSNPKINRLIANCVWGQKDNFVDVPTDCPQRDERLGWTGDAEVFAETASFNMDASAFYAKYLYDMKLEQRILGGTVPNVVPDVLTAANKIYGVKTNEPTTGSCAWGDVATVIPWTLYRFYGDKTLLAEQFENMCLWVDYITGESEKYNGHHLWTSGHHFADWLALDNPDKESKYGGTDNYYVASAFYYYSTVMTAKAAKVLEKAEEQEKYETLAAQIAASFQEKYFTADGHLFIATQTAHVLALAFGLTPEAYRANLERDLKTLIEKKNIHLDTGFVGTRFLCEVLSDHGMNAYAYSLLFNEDFPSWLYEVNMGATTIWERWNSVLPDGHVSGTEMNSMNHYSYGAILGWMYSRMAGLTPLEDAPGFRKAVIAPMPDGRLNCCKASYRSATGLYRSEWVQENGKVRYTVEVPFNAEAEFVLPAICREATVNGVKSEALAARGRILLDSGVYEIIA